MKSFNYYKEQLDQLNMNSSYAIGVKFFDPEKTENNTKQLDLNLESIGEIRKFLDKLETELKKRVPNEN